jgi:hypothetical protein
MAKVSGPLMSMEASGAFAKKLVFGNRLGTNVVRNLVIPSNPQSADQVAQRNMVRVTGAAQHFCNLCTDFGAGRTETDKAALQAQTPAGQTWNSYLNKLMIGAGSVNYAAAVAIWAALSGGEQAAWDAAAAGLTPAILDVAQQIAGGGTGTPISAGEVFLIYTYGLFVAGISAIPGTVPPVYA